MVFEASHDSLTGLPNRKLLMQRVNQSISLIHQDENHEFALLFLDLNNFKNVNDTLGHSIGDQLLTAFGNLLLLNTREVDLVARLGGDEFVILLDKIASRKDAIKTAERLIEELKTPIDLDGNCLSISTSIGIAFSSEEYTNSSQVLRDADTAMYRAKKQSSNKYIIFNQSMKLSR